MTCAAGICVHTISSLMIKFPFSRIVLHRQDFGSDQDNDRRAYLNKRQHFYFVTGIIILTNIRYVVIQQGNNGSYNSIVSIHANLHFQKIFFHYESFIIQANNHLKNSSNQQFIIIISNEWFQF